MRLSLFNWLMTVLLTRATSYQAPYVDIEGLPEISYYEPGDINVAYMNAFSPRGAEGRLCQGSGVHSSAGRNSEAAR